MIRAFRHRRCAGPRAGFLLALALAAIWAPLAPRAAAWVITPGDAVMFCLSGSLTAITPPNNDTAFELEAAPCPAHGLYSLASPPSAPGLTPPPAPNAFRPGAAEAAHPPTGPSRPTWPRAPPSQA